MKKIVFTMGLIVFVLSAFSQSTSDSWLDSNFHSISTVAENSDYSDLQFLKEELRNKNIVAIGEQTHKDGKTFEARSRLIQFLIQEMGYEVIIFESGFYDINYGWQLFKRSGKLGYFTESLIFEWKRSTQHKELFSFIKNWEKKGNRLEMGGFDCKSGYSRHRKNHITDLDSILKINSPEIFSNQEFINYRAILERHCLSEGIRVALPNLSKKEVSIFQKGSQLVRKILTDVNSSFLQTVITTDESVLLYSKLSIFKLFFNKKAVTEANNRRDVLMADNLNYLLENVYENKKVILFGATYHFIRNNHELTMTKKMRISIPESTIMGHLMKTKYQKQIYTIGFSAYGGRFGQIFDPSKSGKKIKPAKDNSLEKKLSDHDLENGLLVLNGNLRKPDWWQDISIRLFSYESSVTCKDWSNVLDAVFFIKEMEPVRYYKSP